MLTQDEAELYDRQIRLWGVNAQSRIRQSKVLMLGFNGVASEVAKILVLAGIDTLTIVDDQPLQDSDLTSNLFCRPSTDDNQTNRPFRTHAVKSKLRTLNPLVKVNIDNSPISSKTPDDYKDYDLVTLHSFLTIEEVSTINDICRLGKIKFYVVLDYGFFGFMFNDLGPEFKFSHEEFVNLANDTAHQSGAAKNPISVGDDAPDDPDDYGYGTSDDENAKPKKRRRLHSPKREVSVKVKDSEKQTVVGSLQYVTFQEMISLRTNAFSRQTSPILVLSISMLKFHSQYKHLPRCDDPRIRQEDLSKLNEIIISLKDSLNLHDNVFKKLVSDWSDHIYSSLSSICAVLGGVAGQDMIRALSNKDIPINNTFSFDGISMTGTVERLGIRDSKSSDVQPIVRDVLQIDDDD